MAGGNNSGAPTVVLVHGAFADSSSWNGVIERLQAKGVQVTCAVAPEEGEKLGDATPQSKDSVLGSVLLQLHYPPVNGGDPGVEFAIDPDEFHDAFAAD